MRILSTIFSVLLASSCVVKQERIEPVHKFDTSLSHYDPVFVSDSAETLTCEGSSCEIRVVVPRHVLIIGDSEACAVGLVAKEVSKEISELTQRAPDVVNTTCKGGTTIQYWSSLPRINAVLDQYPKTDAVFVFLGTNHFWQKSVPSTKNILKQIENRGQMCVWAGNVAVKGKKWPINALLKKEVTSGHVCSYFDSEEAGIELWDGYHPNKNNAKKWLKAVWEVLPLKYETKHYE